MNNVTSPYSRSRKRAYRLMGRLMEDMPHDLQNVGTWSWHYRLITDVGTDNPSLVGTAFPIGENILVTAKHIFKGARKSEENTTIDRSVYAVQGLAGDKFVPYKINRMLPHRTSDLMLLYVCPEFRKYNFNFWVPSWKMCRIVPRKGDIVMGVGFVEGNLRITSKSHDKYALKFWDEDQWSFGQVKNIYRRFRDAVMLPCPCFEVSTDFSSGMSGGPVFDKKGRLCGVVSTGFEGTASSFAVTLWPALFDLCGESLYISSSGTLCWR